LGAFCGGNLMTVSAGRQASSRSSLAKRVTFSAPPNGTDVHASQVMPASTWSLQSGMALTDDRWNAAIMLVEEAITKPPSFTKMVFGKCRSDLNETVLELAGWSSKLYQFNLPFVNISVYCHSDDIKLFGDFLQKAQQVHDRNKELRERIACMLQQRQAS
jgi:hypothetical protein